MSVTSVTCVEVSGDQTEEGHRTYVKTFEVRTSSASDGPVTVMLASGLPTRGDYFSYGNDTDFLAMCKKIGNVKLREINATFRLWRIEAHYSTAGSKEDPNNQPGNPLDWAWKIKFRPSGARKVMSKDKDGRAIKGSADEPFEPLPEIIAPNGLVLLEKNTATLSLSTWWAYQGAVNDAAIWGLSSSRMARINSWTADIVYTGGGGSYVANSFEVEVDRNKFVYTPLDQGFRRLTGVDPDGKPHFSQIRIEGELPSKPVLLNGLGDQLLANASPVFFDGIGGNPASFKLEDEVDFSAVFPNPLPGPFV